MMGQLAEMYAAVLGEDELIERIRAWRTIGKEKMAQLYERQLQSVRTKRT